MKYGRTLQDLALEIQRQSQAKKDYIIDTDAMVFEYDDFGQTLRAVEMDGGFAVNDIAHGQIAQHLGIPAKYYDKMRQNSPELLAENVNHWFHAEPSRRMLRTMDGTARAFLSDRYRRIDNEAVAETVLPIISSMDCAKVESCELTDKKMYIKVVDPKVTAEVSKGDIVQAGIVISNSEVGHGSVNVSPLIFRLVCSNGMIAQDESVRKYHVGRVNEADNDFNIWRNETIEADDKAFLMKVEDAVRAAVDQARFSRIVDRMRAAKDIKIEAARVPQVVELSAREYGITQDESSGILGHLIDGGDLSLYGLANAVTRHSQDVGSYDRATELEVTGWKMLTMNQRAWRQLNEDRGRGN